MTRGGGTAVATGLDGRDRDAFITSMAEHEQDPGKAAASEPAAGDAVAPADAAKKPLPPAAERALAEAAERRAERERAADKPPAEKPDRKGLDPVRYGDWEVKGIASDF